MVKGVISDVDGTLVDSNDAHASAWEEAFQEFGIRVKWEAIRCEIGKGADQLLPCFLTPEQISEQGIKIHKRKKEIFKNKHFDQIRPLPGVPPLFERLHQDKKTIALVTSSGAGEAQYYARLLGIERWVREIISGDDVARTKPYPDLFHVALDRLQWKPSDAVTLGDSPYDVLAAGRIGLPTIAVLTGGFSEESLREAGAAEIYTDLSALLENYEFSLLGVKSRSAA
jgi:HAD superfamily hydrolase (TIGR01509 family)